MKKLFFIFIVLINTLRMQAQVEELITLYDGDASSSGYTLIKDEYQSLNYPNPISPEHCNIIAYTTFNNGTSKIRVQSVASVSKVVIYDISFTIGIDSKLLITGIKYDPILGCNVIIGFCEQNGKKKLFIAQLNETNGNMINYKIHSVSIPAYPQFDNTYALDIVYADGALNNVTTSYFAVGYVSDGQDASIDSKIPFVVAFGSGLNITWVKAHAIADKNNIFNAITVKSSNREIFVSGSLQKDVLNQGNNYRWQSVIIKFNYSGVELNRKLYVNFPYYLDLNVMCYCEQPRIGDILYDNALDKIYVLSWNEKTENPTVQAFGAINLNDQGALKFLLPNANPGGNIVVAFGFKLFNLEDGWIGLSGYSNRLLNANSPPQKEIFVTSCNLNSADLWASAGGLVHYYPIPNSWFNIVNPDIHFNTLSSGSHFPIAFIPSHSIAEYGGTLEGTKYFKIFTASQKHANNTNLYPTINADHYTYALPLVPVVGNYLCDRLIEKADVEAIPTELYEIQPLTTLALSIEETKFGQEHIPNLVYVKDCFTNFKTSNLNEKFRIFKLNFYGKKSGQFEFKTEGINSTEIGKIEIRDLQGKSVYFKYNLSGDRLLVEDNHISHGIYFISIKNTSGDIQSVKFVNY